MPLIHSLLNLVKPFENVAHCFVIGSSTMHWWRNELISTIYGTVYSTIKDLNQ